MLHCNSVNVLFAGLLFLGSNQSLNAKEPLYDPCCSYPCKHNGLCMTTSTQEYSCDCTRTGYYGTDCEYPYLSTRIKVLITPSKKTLHFFLSHYPLLWKVINNISFLHSALMKTLLRIRIKSVEEPCPYNGASDYPSWESYVNKSVYVRTLPPVPLNCPTPMGVKGKKVLPDPRILVDRFFKRKEFIPCPRRTSLIFPLFAQHFTHQFFKTDPGKRLPYQWGDQTLDLSHIYGADNERQHELRSHVDGKMKISMINGDIFPPNVKDADVEMDGIDDIPQKYRFAIGHPSFTMQPTLIFFSTIWLREHNRVCDVLKQEHPLWDDERLFQTTRLILAGETMKIVVEDYVQHLSGYFFKLKYDPELLHSDGFSYHNQIALEFQLLYRWHSLMPDRITMGNRTHFLRDLIFNPGPFVEAGMRRWINDTRNQFAGKVAGGFNQGVATLDVAENTIRDSRRLRIQPMNNYRKRFGLKPYKSFSEFIEDPQMAKELEELYGDVDAMEFFPGIMLEKRKHPLLFGQTLTEIGSPYSLKGIFSNPIGSPNWWKPSTFGGEKGFNIIKTASLQKLLRDNVEHCPQVSFEVPADVAYKSSSYECPRTDDTSQIVMKENWEREYEDIVDAENAPAWDIKEDSTRKTVEMKSEL